MCKKLKVVVTKGGITMFNTMSDIMEATWINPEINPYNYSERLQSVIRFEGEAEFMAEDLILRGRQHVFHVCKLPGSDMTSENMEAYAYKCKHASAFLKKLGFDEIGFSGFDIVFCKLLLTAGALQFGGKEAQNHLYRENHNHEGQNPWPIFQ